MDFPTAIEYLCATIRLAKARGKRVATELASVGKIYVAIELAKAKKNYVVTKIISAAIELAVMEGSIAHDRVGRAQIRRERLAHSVHDRRPACTTGALGSHSKRLRRAATKPKAHA